ncbi:37S ribosomal protein S9, mitochondrial [Coemansia biformis]|uniref:37S ribosomal protein S9, mitochondrial n=1 Tax=Coemansia biformis TaxID=1286918 RepID=A0A9W7Y8Z4_9FUNG|nr:37S ribosomal protein S9, mitochondrial [Coemansia biformis]
MLAGGHGRRAAVAAANGLGRARYATKASSSPFDVLDIRPVQRPDTAAYFMAKPKYADLLAGITSIVQQHGAAPAGEKGTSKKGARWINQENMAKKLDVKLTANEYMVLRERLNQANSADIEDATERDTVQLYLNQFRMGYQHVEVVKLAGSAGQSGADSGAASTSGVSDVTAANGATKEADKKKKKTHSHHGNMDELGRWFGGGRRKTAHAYAWLTPVEQPALTMESVSAAVDRVAESVNQALREAGLRPATSNEEPTAEAAAAVDESSLVPESVPFGEVLVNGRPLVEYFARRTDRESVVFPFQVANRLGKFYAFLKVRGGGPTGQAEACQLAVARALSAATDRSGRQAIKTAGLLITDGRAVERKKTGKPKARKSYTWVKR